MPQIGKVITAVLLLMLMLPAMGMVWVKDSQQSPKYCTGCHQEPYVTGWEAPDSIYLAHNHAERGVSCQTCHDRTMSDSVHEMATYVKGYVVPLPERKLPKQTCLACHGSYAKIIPLTEPALTGGERNPHNGHWGELECSECHKMHRDSVDYCGGCHFPTTDAPGWVLPTPAPLN